MSDSLSKLSSHQIPHCLLLEGTTTAKGLYGKSDFEFNHYAFGSVCATSALCTLALHFGFGADQACSAAARVTSSLPISGLPFVLRVVLRPPPSLRGVTSLRGAPPADPRPEAVHSPFVIVYVVFLPVPLSASWIATGADGTCFPSAFEYVQRCHFRIVYLSHFTALVYDVPRGRTFTGAFFLFNSQVACSGVRIVSLSLFRVSQP